MTTEQKVIRKLRAILSADVKGYSLLMSNDETSTIQTLKEYRIIMSEIIKQHSGRVVDAPGDNLLAEFSSVVNAVQSSVDIQNALKEKNADIPDDKRLEFRIGINIGDVVQDGDSLYGEGVNIASRIEGLADPGGVCISRGAYDHIRNKLKLGYEYIGEHSVKNIKNPVRIYKVLMEPEDAGKLIGGEQKSLLKTLTWSCVIVAAIIIVAYLFIQKPAAPEFEPASVEKMALPLPEKSSIAVLPFDNMSKDPDQEYFCDGITENIISSLAKVPQLLVIARNSTFAYKDKSINIQQIGRELNARYIIEGSIQKSNDRFRITAQLIDTDSGHHIWSESYDRAFNDIFKLQDEITLEILKAVGIKLQAPWSEGYNKGFADISSFIMYQKLLEYGTNPTREKYGWALKNTEKLITLNPEFPMRYNVLAMIYLQGLFIGSCDSVKMCLSEATNAIEKSFSIVADNFWAHQQSGNLFLMRKEYDQAILAYKKAIELNPNNSHTYMLIGQALNFCDKPVEALEYLNKGLRLDPFPPAYFWSNFGFSYRLLEEYDKAIKMYKKSVKREPNYWVTYAGLAISYSLSGQDDNAKTSIRKLLHLFPDFSIEYVKQKFHYKNPAQLERSVKAFRKAGLPETSQ